MGRPLIDTSPRNVRITLAVTADEKAAVETVRKARRLDAASAVLRLMGLTRVVRESRRISGT